MNDSTVTDAPDEWNRACNSLSQEDDGQAFIQRMEKCTKKCAGRGGGAVLKRNTKKSNENNYPP